MSELSVCDEPAAAVNEVHVVGKVSHVGEVRELPSGDHVQILRVVVRRPVQRRGARGRGTPVDVFDVACWTARTRRSAARLEPGDAVDVTGALRRRFFRVGAAASSRYEIEAATLRRLQQQ